MKITNKTKSVTIDGSEIRMRRTTAGVVELWGMDEIELAKGMGFVHAHDRMVQMMMVRLIGQGRLSECLNSDEETRKIDIFSRERGFFHDIDRDVENCRSQVRAFGEAYCAGVNHHLQTQPIPFELKMVGYRPEPWRVTDTLLVIKLMSYVGLAQIQEDLEKFLIQAIRGGTSVAKLRKVYQPYLDGLDEELIEPIKKLKIVHPMLPPEIRFHPALPKLIASNNWALAGNRSKSGQPLQCNDPHLECNRLPPVWYEFVAHTKNDYRIGINTPGVPGLLMGRTRNLSMGFTYGFMDMIDYFVEDCRGGRYRRGSKFSKFQKREEKIIRKKSDPITLTIYENEHGVLETDSSKSELEDGFYLCRAWSAHRDGAADTLGAIYDIAHKTTVPEAQKALRNVAVSANWVIADQQGNIGFQQSGRLPDRKHSGLHPVAGWKKKNDWAGMVNPKKFANSLNPEEGIVVTANHDVNQDGSVLTINNSMGPHRFDRITELLSAKKKYSLQDMKRVQADLYSKQAELYMQLLAPLVPDCPASKVLLEWDKCYTADSMGATVFDAVYDELLREVFGRGLFGVEAWDELMNSTSLVMGFYNLLDTQILGEESSWLDEDREKLLHRVLLAVLRTMSIESIQPWGANRKVMMNNIFFGGRLPRRLRVDYGPITLEGHRTTIAQGSIIRTHGRLMTIYPSYRYLCDLAHETVWTVIAGGPSGKAFSRYYRIDLKRWLNNEYKQLDAFKK